LPEVATTAVLAVGSFVATRSNVAFTHGISLSLVSR
jgi:hypothetical protein